MYAMSSSRALCDDDLRIEAPAIFAEHPEPGVTERYGFVPTIDVINGMRDEGWFPVSAAQTHARAQDEEMFARHLVRFRRVDDPVRVGDSLAELVLTNSHNRSASYALDVGLFRLLCENGLVVSTDDLGGVRVRHGNRIVDEVIEASYEMIDNLPQLASMVARFEQVQLEPPERKVLAEAAMVMRYGNEWSTKSPITVEALLSPRRMSEPGANDSGDLWTTYNTVQENLFRGGLRGRSRNSGRRVKTRPIRNVSEDVRLNKALWTITERMAELKAA